MMFGGVPISVAMPPSMVAKLSGMRLRLGLRTGLPRDLDIDGHQKRQRRDVVHEGRHDAGDPAP